MQILVLFLSNLYRFRKIIPIILFYSGFLFITGTHIPKENPLRAAMFSQYNQTIFVHASQIFSSLQHEPRDDGTYESMTKRREYKNRMGRDLPYISFSDENERRLTYQLAYSTLKCKYTRRLVGPRVIRSLHSC